MREREEMGGMRGWLCMNKKAGVTSFDVCGRIRGIIGGGGRKNRVRVGHAGTLDPQATGVLMVGVARETTRLMRYVKDQEKTYRAVVKFGEETASGDWEGNVVKRCEEGARLVPSDAEEQSRFRARVEELLARKFTGEIVQTPPLVSAIKVAGRKLYDYARSGEAVEVPSRSVTVHEIRCLRLLPPDSLEIEVRCSPGTYVRSIAQDMGEELSGCGGHLTSLERTAIGKFTLAHTLKLDDVLALPMQERVAALRRHLLPPETAVEDFPKLKMSPASWENFKRYKRFQGELPAWLLALPRGQNVALYLDCTWVGVGRIDANHSQKALLLDNVATQL